MSTHHSGRDDFGAGEMHLAQCQEHSLGSNKGLNLVSMYGRLTGWLGHTLETSWADICLSFVRSLPNHAEGHSGQPWQEAFPKALFLFVRVLTLPAGQVYTQEEKDVPSI